MKGSFPGIAGVEAIGWTVSDLDGAMSFLTRALSFAVVAGPEPAPPGHDRLSGVGGARARVARLRLGDEFLELTEYQASRGRAHDATSRSNDHSFQHVAVVVRDMAEAHRRILQHGARPVSVAPQRLPDWNPAAGGIEAFYFRDPDGHDLELIRFPPGKGDPRWQAAGPDLFQGIDHTAIVVADTDRSLAFYRDALGLAMAGESVNYGPEQERLNDVPGAHLRITGLRAPRGPGIELLEYLVPRDGREAPSDLAANDIAHGQTHLRVGDVAAAHRVALAAGARPVSAGVVPWTGQVGRGSAVLVRDPDGHGMLLAGPAEGAKAG